MKVFRLVVRFKLGAYGDWKELKMAVESLIKLAADSLNGDKKPIEFIKGEVFTLIFEHKYPNQVEAFASAKDIQREILQIFEDKKADAGNATATPREVDVIEKAETNV